MKMKTFITYLRHPADILKGSTILKSYIHYGVFKKFKARLVSRGYMLKNILDLNAYAGTICLDTLSLLLSLAAEHDLDLVSHDIKTAFLYSELKPNE